MDKPPIAPYANIVPFKDNINEILILFNPGTGEIEDFPIIINPEDQEMFDKVLNSQKQNVINNPEKIKFKSDDLTTSYEVFKTTSRPSSYTDFSGNKVATVHWKENGSSYRDKSILPDTKYYYTFRSIDVHGHVSNPTEIYEVELASVLDGATSGQIAFIPVIKTISFKDDKK